MMKSPFILTAPHSCFGSCWASLELFESSISVKRRGQSKLRKYLLHTTRVMTNRAPRSDGSLLTTMHHTSVGVAGRSSFDLCNASTSYLRLFPSFWSCSRSQNDPINPLMMANRTWELERLFWSRRWNLLSQTWGCTCPQNFQEPSQVVSKHPQGTSPVWRNWKREARSEVTRGYRRIASSLHQYFYFLYGNRIHARHIHQNQWNILGLRCRSRLEERVSFYKSSGSISLPGISQKHLLRVEQTTIRR